MHTGLTAGISWVVKKAVKENFNCWPQQQCHKLREVHRVSDGCSHRSEKIPRGSKNPPKNVYIEWQVLQSWLVALSLTLLLVLAAIILPVFFRWWSKGFPRRKKALEAFQAAYAKYEKEGTLAARLDRNTAWNQRAGQTKLHMNTDYALKLYNQMHWSRWASTDTQQTKVLWPLQTYRSAKTRRTDFC